MDPKDAPLILSSSGLLGGEGAPNAQNPMDEYMLRPGGNAWGGQFDKSVQQALCCIRCCHISVPWIWPVGLGVTQLGQFVSGRMGVQCL